MNKTEKAWLAGLFDGEGCVWTRVPKRANVIVEIKMTHKPTILRVHSLFPGRFSSGTLSKKSFGMQPQWRWSLDSKKTAIFLSEIMPYLVTKRLDAIKALKLCSVRTLKERISLDLVLNKTGMRE